jgi:hypothetical protein
VKLGARGVLVASGPDDLRQVSLPPVTPVDTTGAGDCFNAGLIAGLLHELPLPRAAALGCAAGALSTGALGGTAGAPDWQKATDLAAHAVIALPKLGNHLVQEIDSPRRTEGSFTQSLEVFTVTLDLVLRVELTVARAVQKGPPLSVGKREDRARTVPGIPDSDCVNAHRHLNAVAARLRCCALAPDTTIGCRVGHAPSMRKAGAGAAAQAVSSRSQVRQPPKTLKIDDRGHAYTRLPIRSAGFLQPQAGGNKRSAS